MRLPSCAPYADTCVHWQVDDAAEGEEDEEEDDDLATAFEILDLARVLLKKQLDEKLAEDETEGKGKGKEKVEDGDNDTSGAGIRHIKERLADTHDLLAEISLENERYALFTPVVQVMGSITDRDATHNRYPNAIADARESLNYKLQLYGDDSEIIAEAHFKLSLALEFASVTSQEDEEGSAAAGGKEVNQELRDEAAKELQAAIDSTKLKLQNKEVELAAVHSPEDNDLTRKQIHETKEIIADMEQRVSLISHPPPLTHWMGVKHRVTNISTPPGGKSSSTCAAHPSTSRRRSASTPWAASSAPRWASPPPRPRPGSRRPRRRPRT